MQHLIYSRTQKINPNVRPEPTTTIYKMPSASKALQNHQEPYKTCNNHGEVATTIIKWQDSSRTFHNNHETSQSKQTSKNQSTGQART